MRGYSAEISSGPTRSVGLDAMHWEQTAYDTKRAQIIRSPTAVWTDGCTVGRRNGLATWDGTTSKTDGKASHLQNVLDISVPCHVVFFFLNKLRSV